SRQRAAPWPASPSIRPCGAPASAPARRGSLSGSGLCPPATAAAPARRRTPGAGRRAGGQTGRPPARPDRVFPSGRNTRPYAPFPPERSVMARANPRRKRESWPFSGVPVEHELGAVAERAVHLVPVRQKAGGGGLLLGLHGVEIQVDGVLVAEPVGAFRQCF